LIKALIKKNKAKRMRDSVLSVGLSVGCAQHGPNAQASAHSNGFDY